MGDRHGAPVVPLAFAHARDRVAFGRLLHRLAPWLADLDVDTLASLGAAIADLAHRPPICADDGNARVHAHGLHPAGYRAWINHGEYRVPEPDDEEPLAVPAGQALRAVRERAGLPLSVVARQAGTTSDALLRLELGEISPATGRLRRVSNAIARLTGADPDAVLATVLAVAGRDETAAVPPGSRRVGLRLGAWRDELGVTGGQVADAAGMSTGQLHRIETGTRTATPTAIAAIVTALVDLGLDLTVDDALAELEQEHEGHATTRDERIEQLLRERREARTDA